MLSFAAWGCVALLVVALATSLNLNAQMAGTGAIAGTVTDATGAVIGGATVTATSVDQNQSTTRTTTGAGDFSITPLTPGEYTLIVIAKGFEKEVQQHITVNALETVAVNVKLTVGAAQQTITVTTAPPVLETTDATLGAVMDNEMYSSLPLMMGANNSPDQRRATDFAVLMPGVQNTLSSGSNNFTSASGAVNGGNPAGGTSEIYIDGVDLPSNGYGVGDPRLTWTSFGTDSIDQFQVQTIGYSSQYAGQGVQNYSIKQGGNQWHGSVYEYLRNTLLDSWQPSSKTPTPTGAPVPAGSKCSSATLTADTAWCKLGGIKQSDHMDEAGTAFGGPIIKNKLFVFANYGQFRQSAGPKNGTQNFPTLPMLGYNAVTAAPLGYADFSGYAQATGAAGCQIGSASKPCYDIYDPKTQTTYNCSGTACSRTLFPNDQIPGNRISAAAQYINKLMLPYETAVNQSNYAGNLVIGYKSGLSNWYQAGRIDYNMNSKNQISLIVAFGRQASTGPNSSGAANQLGPPFNTAQTYAPQTADDIVKDTWTITPHLVNQFSVAFARYKSFSDTPDDAAQYSASSTGILNMPTGQAQGFPGISFSGGVNNPSNEANYSWNEKAGNTYTLQDNVQWQFGKHSFTFGGQVLDGEFNIYSPWTYSSPMTFTFAAAQTEGYTTTTGGAIPNTGVAWASNLLGAVNTSAITAGVPGLGAYWKDTSFWGQDDYKITSKLTVNAGLRWDLWPPVHERKDLITWLNPTQTNSITGNLGTLAFAGGNPSDGFHTGQHIPSSMWYKNLAPRVGLAYALGSKTVIRTSYGVAFARGDWISSAQKGSPSTTGLTPTASAASVPSNQPQFYWDATACTVAGGGTGTVAGDGFTPCGWTGSVAPPTSVLPSGATLAELGTVETAALAAKNSATITYWNPYRGSRTPEYENWSFGIERQLTSDMSVSVNYVGSEGHFLSVSNAMYQTNNKLPESFAALSGYTLTASGGSAQTTCAAAQQTCLFPVIGQKATTTYLGFAATDGFAPQNGYAGGTGTYYASNAVYQYYLPYPQFSGVSDTTSFVGNENWNALEIIVRQRPAHGLNWMASYTWSKSIDDLGTFRVYDNTRLDRSLSAASQPQNLTITAVYALPIGKGHWGGDNPIYRQIASGWAVSGIGTYRSGLPILLIGGGCAGSSILNTCMPNIVPGQAGRQYTYGKTASGAKVNWDPSSANFISNVQYVNPAAFTVTNAGTCLATGTGAYQTYNGQAYNVCGGPADYVPGNATRVAPANLWAQDKPNLDMSLRRTFPIYHEWNAAFDVDMSNVFNHVIYNGPSALTVQSGTNATFGQVTTISNYPRQAQASLRINF
jgi:hypothetical protein